MPQPSERAQQLRDLLNEASYRYHVLDQPAIPDAEYDGALADLRRIEHENPGVITPDSPTQRVGAPPQTAFQPHFHRERMLSLSNAFSDDDLRDFDARAARSRSPSKSAAR